MKNIERIELEFQVLSNEKCYPKVQNAKEIITEVSYKRLKQLYGKKVARDILKRYNYELNSIISNKFESAYLIAYYIANKAREDGQFWYFRGTASSSFVAWLLGISYINPLEYNLCFEEFAGLTGDKIRK